MEETLAIRSRPELENPWQVARRTQQPGEINRCEGNPARGAPSFEQALAHGGGPADDMIIAWSLHNLGHVALHSGDLEAAAARFRESELLRWQAGPRANVTAGLAGAAGVALGEGPFTDAVRLLGAVDGMLETTHNVLSPAEEGVRRDDLAAARDHSTRTPLRPNSERGVRRSLRISTRWRRPPRIVVR